MATPIELGLIKAGVDAVIKIQTAKGGAVHTVIAPEVTSDNQGYYKSKVISGFGDASAYGRGVAVTSDRKIPLYEQDYYPLIFAKAFEYSMWDKTEDYYKVLASNVADVALAMRRRKNKEAAGLFNNGFDGTNFPIYDGQALFSTAHPGTSGVTGSNRPASGQALSAISLETNYAAWLNQIDPRGENMEFEGKVKLLVPNALYPLAWRLCGAQNQPGTGDNDPNFVGQQFSCVRVDKLTSSTAYFIIPGNEEEHGLRTINFSGITVKEQDEARTFQTVYVIGERYRCVALKWNGTYGDPGA